MRNHLFYILTEWIKKIIAVSAALVMVMVVLLQPTSAFAASTTGTPFLVDHTNPGRENPSNKVFLQKVGLFDGGDFWVPKPVNPVAYFPSCTVGYQRCIERNGNTRGSVYGTSNCADCMRLCNGAQWHGVFPTWMPGCKTN